MIKDFVEAWYRRKDNLREYIATHMQAEYSEYKALVKLLFDIVINREMAPFATDEIVEINHGNYQGTLIYLLHKNYYQPGVDEYVYTSVEYGSCSGCDTLQKISAGSEGRPSVRQVEDYMMLCLHLLQNCTYMRGLNDK